MKGREIYPNVDFYGASIAQPKLELYRPDADYVGSYCGSQVCPYIPIEERSK